MPRCPSFSIDRSDAELVGVQLEVEPIEDRKLPSNYIYLEYKKWIQGAIERGQGVTEGRSVIYGGWAAMKW